MIKNLSTPPPALYELEQTALDAHYRRGELVKCGFGYALPEQQRNPAARLLSYGKSMIAGTVVCDASAAWVWTALTKCPELLHLNLAPGVSRIPGQARAGSSDLIRVHHGRLSHTDVTRFAQLRVTTPQRTLRDLLFNTPSVELNYDLQQACQYLAHQLQLDREDILKFIRAKKHPQKARALMNVAQTWWSSAEQEAHTR